MKSFAAKAAPIVAMFVVYLIGRRVAGRGHQRLRQSLMKIDANLAEIQRLREMPTVPGDEVMTERVHVEISDWDASGLASRLGLKPNH